MKHQYLATLLLLLLLAPGSVQAGQEPDDGGVRHQREELKLLKGDPDGHLRPDDAVKRNELIELIDRNQRDLESDTQHLAPKTGVRELLDLLQQTQRDADSLEERVTEIELDQDRLDQREEHLPRPSL